jgi:hypothetical protein
MTDSKTYKITFINQGEIYELYAKQVYQPDLYGFVVIEEIVFGEKTSLVVDPSEERLKSEFDQVKRSYIPMHAVLRIDEVEKEGISKVKEVDGKVAQFPSPVYTPSEDSGKKSEK